MTVLMILTRVVIKNNQVTNYEIENQLTIRDDDSDLEKDDLDTLFKNKDDGEYIALIQQNASYFPSNHPLDPLEYDAEYTFNVLDIMKL